MKRTNFPRLTTLATTLVVLAGCLFVSPASAISDNQKGAISTNCATIKQTLSQLAKSDSRIRVLLGTTYEELLSDYITPLNVRLTKNNQPDTTLTKIQSDFISKRSQFTANFTDYMKQLEDLTNTDCKTQPEDFYAKLESTRTKRATLQQSALELNSLAYDHVAAVTKLKDSL